MQAQKRRVYNQPGGVYHQKLQKYAFTVSESLKIETESQRDTTKCPAIKYQLPDYYTALLNGRMG